MHDGGLPRFVEPVQRRHGRIEREEGVERQARRLAVEQEGLVAAQGDPVRIADGGHHREPVERATQHDDEHARIAALGAGDPGHVGPGEEHARAQQQLAACRGVEANGHDDYLR